MTVSFQICIDCADPDRLATITRVLFEEGIDHYGVAMKDPEGNEFDIN